MLQASITAAPERISEELGCLRVAFSNPACLGYTETNLNNRTSTRTVGEGNREPVRLALLDANAPTGMFSNEKSPLPW
jgi:hypothetical protein